MNQYDVEALDAAVLAAVTAGNRTFRAIRLHAVGPVDLDQFRRVDRALQRLRRKGLIVFAHASGWRPSALANQGAISGGAE